MNIFRKLTPKGRITRIDYWSKFLLYSVVCGLFEICFLSGTSDLTTAETIVLSCCRVILYFCLFYPIICQRLHDIGKSSSTVWLMTAANAMPYLILAYLLASLKPRGTLPMVHIDIHDILLFLTSPLCWLCIIILILQIWFIVYCFLDSQPGENKYGKSAKYPDAPGIACPAPAAPAVRFNLICYALIIVTTIGGYYSNDYLDRIFEEQNLFIGSNICWYICALIGGICAHKNGYSLFSYLCILCIIIGLSCFRHIIISFDFAANPDARQLSATSSFVYYFTCIIQTFLWCFLAAKCTGILRNTHHTKETLVARHPARALGLGLLMSGIIATIPFRLTHKVAFDLEQEIVYCPLLKEIAILFAIKWIYEYLINRQYTQAKSIILAVATPFLLSATCIFLTIGANYQTNPNLLSFLSAILFIACMLFAPASPILTGGHHTTTRRVKYIHLICCAVTVLLSIIICAASPPISFITP